MKEILKNKYVLIGVHVIVWIIILVAFVVLGVFAIIQYRDNEGLNAIPQKICTSVGGTWYRQYKECVGGTASIQSVCVQSGGKFSNCESPCRHDPSNKVCPEMCVSNICQY